MPRTGPSSGTSSMLDIATKERSHSTLVRQQKNSSKNCTGGSVTDASHIATNPLL